MRFFIGRLPSEQDLGLLFVLLKCNKRCQVHLESTYLARVSHFGSIDCLFAVRTNERVSLVTQSQPASKSGRSVWQWQASSPLVYGCVQSWAINYEELLFNTSLDRTIQTCCRHVVQSDRSVQLFMAIAHLIRACWRWAQHSREHSNAVLPLFN